MNLVNAQKKPLILTKKKLERERERMDGPSPTEDDLNSLQQPKMGTTPSKRKKKLVPQKTLFTLRIEANVGEHKGEGPPSDFWSWRKYGQKPIKGSPYPRGYYRCSSSKGCSAKKQVERSKTDASVLIITYTTDHNHPGPDLPSINPTKPSSLQTQSTTVDCPTSTVPNQSLINTCEESPTSESSSPPSPPKCSQETSQQDPPTGLEETHGHLHTLFGDEEPIDYPSMMMPFTSASSKSSEENDFFDELEELTIPSSLTLVGSSFFDERILLPSSQTTFS